MKYTKVFRGDMADVLWDYGKWFAEQIPLMKKNKGTIEYTFRGKQGSTNAELEVTLEYPERDT